MSENEKVTAAAGIVAAATLLSRIFGLVRDLVTAYFFGAGMAADAFFVAFRIPNLLRRLVAEGALTVSVIPIFTEYLTTRSREEAFALARACMTLFSIILVVVSLLGVLLSPYLIMVFAPGFTAEPDKFQLTVLLTKIMFPYILLVALVALAMGILNSLGRFAAPALSPVVLNIGMIASMFLLTPYFDPPIIALAIGVILGGLLQVLLQIPYLAKEKGLLGISFDFTHPAIKRIGLLMAPAALGAAAYQFSVLVNTLLASFLPQGSVSYLYYADRIMQFPLGVFAVAIGTAVLPSMSRQSSEGDMEGFGQTFSYALRLVFFITIPAMVGMIVLAEPILKLLFQRGEFDPETTRLTAQALIAYAVGLWSYSAVFVVVRAFYALQNTKTPVKIAIISLAGNILCAVLLMGPMQHVGLALASSIGSIINLVLLVILLRKRLGRLDGRRVAASVIKNSVWAVVMGVVVYLTAYCTGSGADGSNLMLAARVIGSVILGVLVYLGLAFFFKAPELKVVLNMFLGRFRRRAA